METKKINKTKQKILNSAEKLFSEKGFDTTSIDDITKAAETTKSLFYYYFKTKNDILYYLMKSKIENTIKTLAEQKSNGYLPSSKEEIYNNCITLIKENENIFKIAIFELLKTNNKKNIILELPKEIFAEFKDIFVFTKEEQLDLLLIVIKIATFWALRKSICEIFNIDEFEFENKYIKNMQF